MRQFGRDRTALTRGQTIFGTAAVLGIWLIASTTYVAAVPLPTDPVEELRHELRVLVRDASKNPDQLKFRERMVQKRIDALKTIGEMRRALLLQEWKGEDRDEGVSNVDKQLRLKLAKRFEAELTQVLTGDDPIARAAAAELIGEIGLGGRGVVSRLGDARELGNLLAKKITDDPEALVRSSAATSLGKIYPDAKIATTAMGKLLTNPASTVGERRAAAEGLLNLVKSASQLARGRGNSGVDVTRADIVDIGTLVAPTAAQGLSDDEVGVRRFALEAIQNSGLALNDLIADPRPRLELPPPGRTMTPDERAEVEDYAKQVQDEQTELFPLARALKNQAAALAKASGDSSAEARFTARQAFEEMALARTRFVRRAQSVPEAPKPAGGKDATELQGGVPILLAARKKADPKNDPADELLQGLRIGLPALITALQDTDRTARLQALDVIEVMGEKAAPAGPALVDATSDKARFVRWAAARSLNRMAPAHADIAVPALSRLVTERDLNVSSAAAHALERYSRQAGEAVPNLTRVVADGDVELRLVALKALESIGTEAEPALPTVISVLSHKDARVRRAAAETLAHFGPPAIAGVPALKKALDDDDADVRRNASDAILSILRREATK